MSRILTFNYDHNYQPIAPVLEILVDGYDDAKPSVSVLAFLDSGADGTMLPRNILDQIGAEFEDSVMLRGTAGGVQRTDRFTVRIGIGGQEVHAISAVAMPNNSEPIIGRDILNHFAITLNGPAATTEIQID